MSTSMNSRRFTETCGASLWRMTLLLFSLVCCVGMPVRQAHARDGQPRQGAEDPKVWKILIIGNSYCYFNNLPEVLEQVALSDKPARHVHCEMIAGGGATLRQHWQAPKARKAIERGGWDFVVLQEQSTLGVTYLVQGHPRITASPGYVTYARHFDEVIRKAGARTVLLAFWARENAPAEDRDALAYYHFQLGKDLGALVAPVGFAWQAARKRDARLALYHADHSHPLPEGTYLAACTLYATCFGAAPAHPPMRITGHPIDVEGKVSLDRQVSLVKVSPERARAFRDAANQALATGRQFARELERHQPTLPRLPQLGRGRRPSQEELQGEWTGETKVYPAVADRAVRMSLHLTHAAGGWRAEGKLSFKDHPPDVVVLKITDFRVTDEGISFVDANKAQNGGAVARYRGTFTGGVLRGIAEFDVKKAHLHVIGSWELKKK